LFIINLPFLVNKIFIYISAAFEMLDHDRLLNRTAKLFGLSGQVIDWLESYLTGRTNDVSDGKCRWSTVYCRTGIPQGSVLGPFLFSVFTTPVSRLFSTFNVLCHHYADDIPLICRPTMTSTTCWTVLMKSPDGTSITICCSTHQYLTCSGHRHTATGREVWKFLLSDSNDTFC